MTIWCEDCKKVTEDEVLCDWCEKLLCRPCAGDEDKHGDGTCCESEGE